MKSKKRSNSLVYRPVLMVLVLILVSLSTVACQPQEEKNSLDRGSMGAIKRLAIIKLTAGDHLVLKEAASETSGDTLGSTLIGPLLKMDANSIVTKMAEQQVGWQLTVLDSRITGDTKYATALQTPQSVPATTLAEIARLSGTDGLLWLEREYRIRGTKSPLGDKYHTWTGEVASHLVVYDVSGQRVLNVRWINESETQQGVSIQGSGTVSLLTTAVERAAGTTVRILSETTAGRDLPQDLQHEKTESEQGKIDALAEGGICVRGLLVIGLIWVGVYAITKVSTTPSGGKVLLVILFIVTLGGAGYLLIGRNWWKDTILAIIRIITDVIFG